MTTAEVMLWGTKIGTVAFDDNSGLGSFEYDPAFLTSRIEVSPIAMPLSRRVYTFPELARQSFNGRSALILLAPISPITQTKKGSVFGIYKS